MDWLDTAIDFLGNHASDILGAGGVIAGALGEGQAARNPQSAAVQWGTGMQPEAKSQMEALLSRIQKYGSTGYQGIPRRGLTAEDTDPIFGSKARQQLYNFYNSPVVQAQVAKQAEQETPRTAADLSPDVLEALVMGQYAALPEARKQQALTTMQLVKNRAGETNKYSGEKVDYPEWLRGQLKMGNSGASQRLISAANPEYRAGLEQSAPGQHAAMYDPSSSFLDAILPSLALAAMTGGAGMVPGLPANALKAIKGVTTLTGMGR